MKKLIKKILILTVIAAMVVTAMPLTGIDFGDIIINAKATDTYISGDYEYTVSENNNHESTAWILKYNGKEKNLIIPEMLDGNIVEYILDKSFEDNQYLESVVLPDTVTAIFYCAFKNCKNLKSVKFPETAVALEEYCFYGCERLEEVKINLDLSNDCVLGVGKEVFANSGVKKIILAEGITTFPAGLLDSSLIEEIEIPESVAAINKDAFEKSICETVIIKGVISPSSTGSWTRNATENGRIDKIIYYQTPGKSANEDYYFSRYDTETGYWICELSDAFVGCKEDEIRFIDEGDFRYGITPNGEAYVWEYLSEETEVIIPSETSEGNPVVALFDQALWLGKKHIKKVVIPSSVRAIGCEAFKGCTELEEIIIPDTVKIIGDNAFIGCTSLKTIDYPPMDYIPIGAFSRCSSLTEFVVPETVKAIGGYAFGSCTSLSSVTLNEGLKEIGYNAFSKARLGNGYPCITELVLPESLEYIGGYAFRGLSLNKIIIPAGVKEIKSFAFAYSKISEVTLNEGVEKIGNYAFYYCENLEKTKFPDTVNYIGNNAFEGCTKIKSIDIPPLLTEISKGAFSGILGIKSIVIPSTVKVIGESAFDCCENLNSITIENGAEEIRESAFRGCSAKEITIPESVKILGKEIVENSLIETLYYNAVNAIPEKTNNKLLDKRPIFSSYLKKVVFGETVKSVPINFSYGCATLEEIVFSDSIENILWRAFSECASLKKLDLPQNLKLIDYGAFADCTSITEIVLPDGLEKIDSMAFSNCIALTEITLPEGLESLNQASFKNCTGIKIINFNSANCKFISIETTETDGIYYSPFKALTALETINLGANIKELPAYLFCGIETIDEFVLPSTVTDVGVGAFAFSSITSFKGSENLESIEESAFYGCKSLESADFSNDIMIIGANAFTDCDKLTEIYIPDSVTNIEMESFKNCPSLQSVRMSPNVDYIPREAFYNCTELSSFTWEADSKLVGRLAFGNCVKLTDFDFLNVEKLYVNSFLGSGVAVVQLGESVNEASPSPLKTIEVQSFKDCENLATLGIGGNVTTVKSQAFADCTNLETAVIADSVTEIAEDAFDGCDKLTIYCSEDSYAHSYAQTQGIKVSTFVIAPIPNQTYTGFEIKPEISVSLSGNNLNQNTDFGIAYANNINVGNADVTVTGKGDFRMYMSKANFTIVTKNIAQATVAPIAEQNYTGSPITPAVTITDGGNVLREGVDYTLTFSGNVDEGTAKVKIKGIGNYSGTAEAEFQIKSQSRIRQIMTALSGFANSIFARLKALITAIFR